MSEAEDDLVLTRESFPLYFEGVLNRLGISIWVGAIALAAVIGIIFGLSDLIAGVSTVNRITELTTLLLSLALSPVFLVIVRNKSLVAFRSISSSLAVGQMKELLHTMSNIFDQRNSVKFALIVSAGGIAHHVILSYLQWGTVWWYSAIDIVMVGFLWWFIVATFLWTCLNVSAYSYVLSKRLKFVLRISSRGKMLGLEGYGTLAVFPAVLWGIIATLGTSTTFDPLISAQHPEFIAFYLWIDFIISALSMTGVFLLPLVGFRHLVIPLKRDLLKQLRQLMSELGTDAVPSASRFDSQEALNSMYLWQLSSQIEGIKEWPLSLGAGLRFAVSYLIPGLPLVVRWVYLYAFKRPLPV
jgi:hypothetical protein